MILKIIRSCVFMILLSVGLAHAEELPQVKLAPDTPEALILPPEKIPNQPDFMKGYLMASADKPLIIDKIRFHYSGTDEDISRFQNFYFYVSDQGGCGNLEDFNCLNLYGDSVKIEAQTKSINFDFSNSKEGSLVVEPGKKRAFKLTGFFDKSYFEAGNYFKGEINTFAINTPNDIKTSDESTINGDFPIKGHSIKIENRKQTVKDDGSLDVNLMKIHYGQGEMLDVYEGQTIDNRLTASIYSSGNRKDILQATGQYMRMPGQDIKDPGKNGKLSHELYLTMEKAPSKTRAKELMNRNPGNGAPNPEGFTSSDVGVDFTIQEDDYEKFCTIQTFSLKDNAYTITCSVRSKNIFFQVRSFIFLETVNDEAKMDLQSFNKRYVEPFEERIEVFQTPQNIRPPAPNPAPKRTQSVISKNPSVASDATNNAPMPTPPNQIQKIESDPSATEKSIIHESPMIPRNNTFFSDVSSGHENYQALFYVREEGIVSGYEDGTFKPQNQINRAEFTKIIVGAIYEDSAIYGENCFTDVNQQWYAKYICTAKRAGIIKGYDDGSFRPGNNIKFVEATKIIAKAFDFGVTEGEIWYENFVRKMTDKKAIPLSITKLEQEITRGEMAEMVYRVKAKIENKPSFIFSELTEEQNTPPQTNISTEFNLRDYQFFLEGEQFFPGQEIVLLCKNQADEKRTENICPSMKFMIGDTEAKNLKKEYVKEFKGIFEQSAQIVAGAGIMGNFEKWTIRLPESLNQKITGKAQGFPLKAVFENGQEKMLKTKVLMIKWEEPPPSSYGLQGAFFLEKAQFKKAWTIADHDRLSDITVAVIDMGVDTNHPDITNHIWTNPRETQNNKDDDQNGYVDDLHGWDFVWETSELTPLGSHGTAVSGIIAADPKKQDENINATEFIGAAYGVKIMPVTVMGPQGSGDYQDIVRGIEYAIDNGADVINLSIGTIWTNGYTDYFNPVMEKARKYNIPIVAAVGNGDISGKKGMNLDINKVSPACNDGDKNWVIGVSALDKNNEIASWANYGGCVDVYAPGEAIPVFFSDIHSMFKAHYQSGTSYAAPMVSSTVALMKSVNPCISYEEILAGLQINGEKLNAYESVQYAKNAQCVEVPKPDPAGQKLHPQPYVSTSEDNIVPEASEMRELRPIERSFLDRMKGKLTEKQQELFDLLIEVGGYEGLRRDFAQMFLFFPYGFFENLTENSDYARFHSLYEIEYLTPKSWKFRPFYATYQIYLSPDSVYKPYMLEVYKNAAFNVHIEQNCDKNLRTFDDFVKARLAANERRFFTEKNGPVTMSANIGDKMVKYDYFVSKNELHTDKPLADGDFKAEDYFIKNKDAFYRISFEYSTTFENKYRSDALKILNSFVPSETSCLDQRKKFGLSHEERLQFYNDVPNILRMSSEGFTVEEVLELYDS